MPDDLTDRLRGVPSGMPTVPWLSTAQIRRRARWRIARAAVGAGLTVLLVVAITAVTAAQLTGTRAPINPAIGTSAALQVPVPVLKAAMLTAADLPRGYTFAQEAIALGTTLNTANATQYQMYRVAETTWPFARFNACPQYPTVTAYRSRQATRVHIYAGPSLVSQGDQRVEAYPSKVEAAQVMDDMRLILASCGAYPKAAGNRKEGFAGDDSLAFVVSGVHWVVVRLGNLITTLRLDAPAEGLADLMVHRVCLAYRAVCAR